VRRFALVLVLAAVAAVGAAAPSSASWHYKFQDFLDYRPPGATGFGFAKAKKCGPGGKQGTYDYVSRAGGEGGDTSLEVEVRARLSARDKFRQLRDVSVGVTATPNFDPATAQEVARALEEFHETVFTRWRGPGEKMKVRHGDLTIFGTVALAAAEDKVKFKPKPGC